MAILKNPMPEKLSDAVREAVSRLDGGVTAAREAISRIDGSVSRAMYGRTVLALSAVACVAAAAVVWRVSAVERTLLHSAAMHSAAQQLRSIDLFRSLDLANVEPPIDPSGPGRGHFGPTGGPPLPGSVEFDVAHRVAKATASGSIRVYSPYPFAGNLDGGLPDAFAAAAWQRLQATSPTDPTAPVFHRYENIDGREMLRYAKAEVMRPQCVACHNAAEASPKRDWKVGDVAGIVEVSTPANRTVLLARAAAGDMFLFLVAITATALVVVGLLIRRVKRTTGDAKQLAIETDRINRTLEREVAQRSRAEAALSVANERLSTNHAQLERWAADLEIAHTRLRELDELKTKFLSEVSHELRSPVAAIVSAAKIITKHHASKPEVVNRFGKTIISEGERMTRLINDFLDLTKIESGCTEWNEKEVDPEALVQDVIVGADALAMEAGVRLIPAVMTAPPKILVDPDRLFQVLTNLVNNAIKHTPEGGTVTMRVIRRARDVQFSVDDTGPGIPPDQLALVFDRFRQVREDRNDGKKRVGTGLGLCISREIVQHYGGRIWVESELGHGSSFRLTIPACADAEGEHEEVELNGIGPRSLAPRVLIAIDDPDAAARAASACIDASLECRVSTSVEEFDEIRTEWAPDVFIISSDLLGATGPLLPRVRGDGMAKLLVYSPEHGLTAPSMLDSSELLVPSLRAVVSPGARVLVVEDDEKYRGLLEFELQQAGYDVATAPNGREALACIRVNAADAVILDLVMPGMDGLALLERLAKTGGPQIPILVYTAMDDPSVALAAKDLGATDVFRKDGGAPAAYTAVAARIRRVLSPALAPRTAPAGDESGSPKDKVRKTA